MTNYLFNNFRIACVIIVMLSGCGPLDDQEYQVANSYFERSVALMISSVGGRAALTVSLPSDASSARLCRVVNASCLSWTDMSSVQGGNSSRKFYQVQGIPLESGAQFRVEGQRLTGEPYRRQFRLEQGGSMPNTPNNSGAWKSIFMAADYMDNGQHIVAWDNGRRDLANLLAQRGFAKENSRHLSQDPQVQKNENTGPGTKEGLVSAFTGLNISGSDKCFLFMTSHGSRQAFHVDGGDDISPAEFNQMLDRYCGNRPTVALVSACFSGIMVNQETKKPNRIIFTAASAHKTSQGCAPGIKYNLFEQCAIGTLPNVQTFDEWAAAIEPCIMREDRSDPIFYIGESMKGLKIGHGPQASYF